MERVALRVHALREGDDAAKTAARLVGTGGGLVGLGAEGVLGAVAAGGAGPDAARGEDVVVERAPRGGERVGGHVRVEAVEGPRRDDRPREDRGEEAVVEGGVVLARAGSIFWAKPSGQTLYGTRGGTMRKGMMCERERGRGRVIDVSEQRGVKADGS